MQKDYDKRAKAAYLQRRKVVGDTQVPVWMTAQTRAMLKELTKTHTTQETAIAYAIRKALGEVE